MSIRVRPSLLIVGLALAFFAPLVAHPGWVFYSDGSDLLGFHLPIARFLVGSFRETGELPLWCPSRFGGAPFLHDILADAFYPPQLVLYALPPAAIGPALGWLIVAHVVGAGLGMQAYARARGLEGGAALVAALGFMFSGKWMLHLLGGGHSMTVGLAWLPPVLLLLESAIGRGSLLRATWAGVVFALFCLGTHPQWVLYAGLFLAPWTLGTALERAGCWRGEATPRRVASALGKWMACGACMGTVAALLIAVQLLPCLEAATQSTRGAAGLAGEALAKAPTVLASLIGPPALGMKGFDDWECRGGWGVLWAAAVALAVARARGRSRHEAGVLLGLVAFAAGGAAVVEGLPVFRLFAMPSRMLLIATLPAALLAGTAYQALFSGPAPAPDLLRRGRRLVVGMGVVAVVSLGGMALLRKPRSIHGHPYWLALAVAAPVAFALLGRTIAADPARRRRAGLAWGILLTADLWAMARPHLELRPEADVFPRPACVRALVDRAGDRGRVLDRHLPGEVTRSPVSTPLAMMLGLESVRGYNAMDLRRFREYLGFIADRDDPVRPIRQVANFPIVNKPLLDLFGVRYLVQPSAPALLPGGEPPIAADPRWRKVLDDPSPRTFNIFAGMAPLPAYSVLENRDALPRAFVVPDAAPLPARSAVLGAMKANDFRRRVLLEGFEPGPGAPRASGSYRPARIRRYRPNRVEIGVDGEAPGYLVLADPWFPGWSCAVDGRPARLYRANYLFRAVAVPAGRHEVAFTFAPASYRVGKAVSLATLLSVATSSLAAFALRGRRPGGEPGDAAGLARGPHPRRRTARATGAEVG